MKAVWRYIWLCFLICSCAGPGGFDPESESPYSDRGNLDPADVILMDRLTDANPDLSAFKGLGDLRLNQHNRKPQRFRLALAAKAPASLRLQLNSLFGQPALTMVTDGLEVGVWSHLTNKRYQTSAEKLETSGLPIPLQIAQLVQVCQGRVPVKRFHRLFWETVEGQPGSVLRLKNRWGQTVQQIYFEPQSDEQEAVVTRIETYGNDGRPDWSIRLGKWRQVDSFRVPFDLSFTNAEGDRMHLRFSRYWANPVVSDTLFEPKKLKKS